MLSWIAANFANIVICAVLIAITAAIIIHMIREKRKGKSSCGCADCPMNGNCREEQRG